MAIFSRFSYQKLKKLATATTQQYDREEEEYDGHVHALQQPTRFQELSRRISWLRLRRRRWRPRPRVRVQIARLGRLVRRKARVVRGAVRKVVKRIRDGSPYIGELFAGNYMFMQVTPSPGGAGPTPIKAFLRAHHAAAAAGPQCYSSAMVPAAARPARAVSSCRILNLQLSNIVL